MKKKYAIGEIKVWNKGIPRTDEVKRKLSQINKGKPSPTKGIPKSEEHKEKLRQANLGKKQSEETRQKKRDAALKNGQRPPVHEWTPERRKWWSEITSGEKNGMYGKKRPPELIEKLKQINTGKKLSDEQRQKISLANKGKKVSDETRKKMSDAKKGKKKKSCQTQLNLPLKTDTETL